MFEPMLPADTPASLRLALEQRWVRLRDAQPEAAARLEAHAAALGRVWLVSDYAAEVCVRHASTLVQWLDEGRLDERHAAAPMRERLRAALDGCADEPELLRRLRRFRHLELLVIVWRDATDAVSLEETLTALSDLADTLIRGALDWHYADLCRGSFGQPLDKSGAPQEMVVLGMGKLGGRELNFSSDIDLIFAYPSAGQTNGRRPVTNEEFFTRLGQRVIKALDSTTADGFVYRVDMRLRPFGDAGALAWNFAAMEGYYETHGREWERYALVKARPLTGDPARGEQLMQRLHGFIYRRYLDFGAIEAMREMKQLISQQAARKGKSEDLKVGPGGIREIEFTVQVFQLIYGGRDQHLQGQSLLPKLRYLGERGLMPAADVAELEAAYRFLRRAENHLQMLADQQVHALPADDTARWRLARSLGHADWPTFYALLNAHRERVNAHFQKVFGGSGEEAGAHQANQVLVALWQALAAGQPVAPDALVTAGFTEADAVIERLRAFAAERQIGTLSAQGRQRLDRLMPLLLAELSQSPQPVVTLERVLELLRSVVRRTVYLSLLVERPQVLSQTLRLCAASPWLSENLSRHPILLDELIDPRQLYAPPGKEELQVQLAREFTRIDAGDQEQVLDQLRHFKRAQVFRVAAADIVGALPLMKVSDHLTWIAEAVLEQTLRSAWSALAAKHGEPEYVFDGERRPARFLIIGYGKLGGWEMGYGSDLDIVFLHDSRGTAQQTNGERPIDNAVFFARLAQRIVHLLTVFTAVGKLYEVDMRLRPSGNSGLLVSSLEAFARYQAESAWTWEHQALVRARRVAGAIEMEPAFREIRHTVLSRARDPHVLRREVREMREKMWAQLDKSSAGRFDLKKSPGGITDIEFMVQYLVLAHAHTEPELTVWTDNIRILEALSRTGIVEPETTAALADAYRTLRDEIHRLTLQDKSAVVDASAFAAEQALVKRCWARWLED